MKKLIIAFIVLLAAVWLGLVMHNHPGFVLINFGHTRIETTLWLAVFMLLIVWIVLHAVMAFLKGLFRIPERYANWSAMRQASAAQRHTQQAVFSLLEDQFEQAEKTFLKSARSGDSKMLNYLGAAKSAQLQQSFKQRDKYLLKAKKIADSEHAQAIDMIKIRWQVEAKQWNEALTTLEMLPSEYPFVLKMRYQIYLAEENWYRLKLLLPQLKRKKVLDHDAYEVLESQIYLALMEKELFIRDYAGLEKIWKELPKKLHRNPDLLSVYVECLLRENKYEQAESLLKPVLKHELHPKLLRQYARVVSANPSKQLSRAESWLKTYPEDADLLYCLGKLCVQYRLWGKAKDYFESSIKIRPSKEAYQALGKVSEHLGEDREALVCYREGITQCH